MAMPNKQTIVYVTSSRFKIEENKAFVDVATLDDGIFVKELFEFEIRELNVKEVLEVDLRVMVQAEVASAYSQLKIPCIVEHAGLVFSEYDDIRSYPGGLTKPMWNALGDAFIRETNSSGRSAIARAVIAYCDGMSVTTFVGETKGRLASKPMGHRKFYWDTIFIPDDPKNLTNEKTYAEIVEDERFGLRYKMDGLSQSSRAMLKFLEYMRQTNGNTLWGRR